MDTIVSTALRFCVQKGLTCPIAELQGAVGAVAVTIESKAGRFVGERAAMRL